MNGRRWSLPVFAGLAATGLGVAINLATELKSNAWAWVAVAILTVAGIALGAGSERLVRAKSEGTAAPIVNRGTVVTVGGTKNRVKVNVVGTGALVAFSLVVIVAVVAGMLAGQITTADDGTSPSTGSDPSHIEPAGTAPFHVTVLDEPTADVAYGSAGGYLFPSGTVQSLPAPKPLNSCGQWSTWALNRGGVRVAQTSLAFTIAAVGDEAVRVPSVRLHAERMEGAAAGDQVTCFQGGPIPVSHLSVDLDREQAIYRYPNDETMGGAPRPFALQIAPGEAEHVSVEAVSLDCYCSWYLELLVEVGGAEHRYRVDHHGEPFVTAPAHGNYTNYIFDPDTRQWEPGFN